MNDRYKNINEAEFKVYTQKERKNESFEHVCGRK